MSKKQKPYNNYVLLVDYYKPPHLKHNTAGRYKVGAKTRREAVELLKKEIGFGSIQVYYECKKDDDLSDWVQYGEVWQEVIDKDNTGGHFLHVKPHHASENRSKWEAVGVVSQTK